MEQQNKNETIPIKINLPIAEIIKLDRLSKAQHKSRDEFVNETFEKRLKEENIV